jgi:hypothetical protein
MKEIQVKDKTYFFVEIPIEDRYTDYDIDKAIYTNLYDLKRGKSTTILSNKEIDFQIISTTKDITEEQAESIVERLDNENSFKDYELEFTKDCEYILATAKESLQSLIQANGLDVNKNYLILQKL